MVIAIETRDRWLTDSQYCEALPNYTRANAGEVLPAAASPLGWTLAFQRGVLKGWGQGFVDFGVFREDEVRGSTPPFVGSFGGYFYLNLSMMRRMAVRMGVPVPTFDSSMLGGLEKAPAYVPDPADDCPECSERIARTMDWVTATDSFPEVDEDRRRVREIRRSRPDFSTLSDRELVDRAVTLLPELENGFYRHVFSSLPSSVGPGMLNDICSSLGRPELALELISGIGEVDSAGPASGLWELSRQVSRVPELARVFDAGVAAVEAAVTSDVRPEFEAFRSALAAFLEDFGFRGPNEWDIHAPSWESRPDIVLRLIDALRKSPSDVSPETRREALHDQRLEVAAEVRELLSDDAEALASFEVASRSAAVFVPARERTKTTAIMAINEIRMTLLELGARRVKDGVLGQAADIMMLLAHELDDFVASPADFTDLVAARRLAYDDLEDLIPPYILSAPPLPLAQWDRHTTEPAIEKSVAGAIIRGVGGCGGAYTGVVRIIDDPTDPGLLEPGDVLVSAVTDTAWTPLFLMAGAVVVDTGATNSHAVIVCREIGRPCVVSATDASRVLRDGMVVTVDGDAGTVTLTTEGSA